MSGAEGRSESADGLVSTSRSRSWGRRPSTEAFRRDQELLRHGSHRAAAVRSCHHRQARRTLARPRHQSGSAAERGSRERCPNDSSRPSDHRASHRRGRPGANHAGLVRPRHHERGPVVLSSTLGARPRSWCDGPVRGRDQGTCRRTRTSSPRPFGPRAPAGPTDRGRRPAVTAGVTRVSMRSPDGPSTPPVRPSPLLWLLDLSNMPPHQEVGRGRRRHDEHEDTEELDGSDEEPPDDDPSP